MVAVKLKPDNSQSIVFILSLIYWVVIDNSCNTVGATLGLWGKRGDGS